MVEAARMLVLESGKPMEVDAAREGSEVWLGARAMKSPVIDRLRCISSGDRCELH